jgi:hypothetical protein
MHHSARPRRVDETIWQCRLVDSIEEFHYGHLAPAPRSSALRFGFAL